MELLSWVFDPSWLVGHFIGHTGGDTVLLEGELSLDFLLQGPLKDVFPFKCLSCVDPAVKSFQHISHTVLHST